MSGTPSRQEVETLCQQIDELWIYYCREPETQFEAICQRDGVADELKNATHFYDRSTAIRLRIRSEVDQYIYAIRKRPAPDVAESGNGGVFLSHAASDERIALLLKAAIERRLPGVEVFCSSDPADLPPDSRWAAEIQEALRASSMLMFIASERGLQRPWVWFECGTFWFTGKRILPACLGNVRKHTLPPPLSELQAVNADVPIELNTALSVIASATGIPISGASRLEELCEQLKQLDRDVAAVAISASGWLGADWKGKFLAYDGPYQSLPLTQDDAPFEMSMQQTLNAAGYNVALYDENHFGDLGDNGRRFVQLTDRKSWRSRIAEGRQWLVARPVSS